MKTVVILLGPTGVGKTGASILLAQELESEIISADSMLIYRRMDIGTAKPSLAERALVRHHMIDIVDPSEPFSAGAYLQRVTPILARLCADGKVPVVVGGTGLYIRAMTRGLFSGPSADPALREELLAREAERPGSLFEELQGLDPQAAARIERKDIRRLIRAIEVSSRSGRPISEEQQEHTRPLPYAFIRIGLARERKELYAMIDERVDAMMREGLLDEVRQLCTVRPDQTPLQAIGYKELVHHLQGEITLQEAVRLIKRNSRRYAKRQFTWFRQEPDVQWVDVTGLHDPADIHGMIRTALERKLRSVSKPL